PPGSDAGCAPPPATSGASRASGGDVRCEQHAAIPGELRDRIADVRERPVRRLLREPGRDLRRPALRQDFQRADVAVAVMEVGFELGHLPRQEAPVLADAVPAHRRYALVYVPAQELER